MKQACWMHWFARLARDACLFERPHHRRIADILLSLDPMLLVSRGCLFGGGTAIALRWGEFRESVDIDFLVSDQAGYRELRQMLTASRPCRRWTSPPANCWPTRIDGATARSSAAT